MAKTKAKDQLIEELLSKVEEKKKQIEKIKNPVFKTNLSYGPALSRANLNVATEEDLFLILDIVDRMIDRRENSEVNDVIFPQLWYGFKLEEWRNDIVLKLKQKQSQTQISELRLIENKLNNLMSEDKKKDIELSAINDLLNS